MMNKIIYILFFVFLVNLAIAIAAVPFPIQVYGDIEQDLPAEYDMSFQIEGIEYETGIAFINYGHDPLVKIPADDSATPGKEGYERGDTVKVYINDVLVDEQQYPYLPIDEEYLPYEIDIDLTQQQYDDIINTTQECIRSKCTSIACQSKFACESAGCRWSNGQCRFPSTGGSGGRPAGCYDRWVCGEWSECTIQGTQSKICNNTGTCKDVRPTKTEYQNCTYVPPYVPPVEDEIIPIEEPTPEVEEEPAEEKKSFAWLIYLILAIVAVGGFGFVFYEIEKSRKFLEAEKTKHHTEVHPDTYANLESYIRRTMDMGYTKAQIMQALVKEGWRQQIINQVFSRIR